MGNLTGSCNCGEAVYKVFGAVKKIVNCHCTLCRKMNGAAFSTYVIVLENEFQMISGNLRTHKVSTYASKHFCGNCGTPIYNTNPKLEGLIILHLGSLDCALEITPEVNIFCDSQLGWVQHGQDVLSLPQGL